MSRLTSQDQLLMDLINAMAFRRCSPSYSTSYHCNEQMIALCHVLLETSNSSLSTVLNRIIHNACWFRSHYRASLSTLQQVQAERENIAERRLLSGVFEHDRGVRLDVGALNDAQAERQEVELRKIAQSRIIWPETPLGSHPVKNSEQQHKGENEEAQRQHLQLRLTPDPVLVVRLEAELEIQDRIRVGRGTIADGADEDMILKFWDSY